MRVALFAMFVGLAVGCASDPIDEVGRESYAVGEECKSNDDCKEGEYCQGEKEGLCPDSEEFLGTCVERPGACLDIYDPVCACDGNTYSNACYAAMAGENVVHEGECEKS